MATVHAFEVDGLKLWFWSDDHEPPHFHAKKTGEWEIKIKFLLRPSKMAEVKWAKKRVSAKLLKNLCKLAAENRAILLREWEQRGGQ
jgi:hypothetical protein